MINFIREGSEELGYYYKDEYSDLVVLKFTTGNRHVALQTGYDNVTLDINDLKTVLSLMERLDEDSGYS